MAHPFSQLFFATILLLLGQGENLLAQHPSWRNFTTDDGLRSNEVYGLMQDSKGFIWIATDQGICKFNGYEFTRPADTSITASGSVFKIQEDKQGRIWFNHLDPALSIIENDVVRPWEYNYLMDSINTKYGVVGRLAISDNGDVWVPLKKSGYWVMKANGQHQILPKSSQSAYIFSDVGDHELCGQILIGTSEQQYLLSTRQTNEILHIKGGDLISLGRFPINWEKQGNASGTSAWRLRDGSIIFRYCQAFYLLKDDKLIWYGQKDVFSYSLIEDKEGNILMGSLTGAYKGLLRYRSLGHFMRNEYDNLLPGHAVSGILLDREGGLWVSTTDAGVFYSKNVDLRIYDSAIGLPTNNISCLATDGSENVFAGLETFNIFTINRSTDRISALPKVPSSSMYEFNVLRFDTATGRLWSGPHLAWLYKNHWTQEKINLPTFNADNTVPIKKMSLDPDGQKWWMSSTYGFFKLDRQSGIITAMVDSNLVYERTFSVSADRAGTIWVTTQKGLQCWVKDHYEPPPFTHPALRNPARNVEILPNDGMVIALRGGGLLIRNKNGVFTHLNTQTGLTADWINHMDVGPEGEIYACSNAGLNILRPLADGSWQNSIITIKHGLPSNQVNDVVLLKGELWIATDKGIACFRKMPDSAPMPVPVLEKFVVNNQKTTFFQNILLEYNQNNVALSFFALHFRSDGDIPYRYRLLGADTNFVYTHVRVVNFSNLAPESYSFEVQAQNEDSQWSESAIWTFTICPPWWATWWFRLLIGAILLFLGFGFYQNRLQNIQKEADEREKIRDLETAALRAQMNPHFIFNCLQAIQSFIAKNDANTAASYLARFAKLVRLALHGSVDGQHSLMEEKSMLENYLYLEQMRFKGKFDFAVRSSPGFDLDAVSIPPLLVQPFVENAVLHGLQNIEKNGLVDILFSKKGDYLEVTVTDNGKGFNEAKDDDKQGAEAHKSVGMMLTQKRLDLIAGVDKNGRKSLTIENLIGEDGVVCGMMVRILIPIVED